MATSCKQLRPLFCVMVSEWISIVCILLQAVHVLISTCMFVECLTLLRVRMWITVIHICTLSSVNIIVLTTWSYTYRRASSSSVVRASKLDFEGSVVSSILTWSSEFFSELSGIRILVLPNYIVTKKFHAIDSLQVFRFVQTSSQKRPSVDQLLWSKSVTSLWDGVILFLLDFVINSFSCVSEKLKLIDSQKSRFRVVCERAIILWGLKLWSKPCFHLKLWYREERPFGIHDTILVYPHLP